MLNLIWGVATSCARTVREHLTTLEESASFHCGGPAVCARRSSLVPQLKYTWLTSTVLHKVPRTSRSPSVCSHWLRSWFPVSDASSSVVATLTSLILVSFSRHWLSLVCLGIYRAMAVISPAAAFSNTIRAAVFQPAMRVVDTVFWRSSSLRGFIGYRDIADRG